MTKESSREAIQAYFTAVYLGELNTVEALLKTNPSLVHAQGDLTDLSKRTFTNITGFQYAVWALDGPMWDIILKYLPIEQAAAQIQAYETRQDLIAQHGLRYSFDTLLWEYDNYIKNYSNWDYNTRCHHWQKGIGAAQAMMPSWMIYAFTEPGAKVAWVEAKADKGYLRILSNEFKNFQRVIEGGAGYYRGRLPRIARCEALSLLNWLLARIPEAHHDHAVMIKYQIKSHDQRQALTKILTDSNRQGSTPTGPRP